MRVVASVVLPIGLLSTTSAQISWPDCPCASEEQGCKSGTVDVSARCGCKVWTSYYDGEAFCYVADPSSCAEAQSSNLYPGAASVTCDSHAGHDHGADGVHGGGDDGPNADGSDPDPHAGHVTAAVATRPSPASPAADHHWSSARARRSTPPTRSRSTAARRTRSARRK